MGAFIYKELLELLDRTKVEDAGTLCLLVGDSGDSDGDCFWRWREIEDQKRTWEGEGKRREKRGGG